MITGVVLAAGTGSRFGGTKQIAELDGRPLAQHAVDALANSGVGELLIVTGHDAEAVESALVLPPMARFIRNANYRDGQATSLAAALHDIDGRAEGAVILLADQPGVAPEVIRALIDAFGSTRKQIVRAAYRDGPGPALLSREIFAEAGHLYGDVGARVLMASHPEWVHEVPVDTNRPKDIDTPADLVSR